MIKFQNIAATAAVTTVLLTGAASAQSVADTCPSPLRMADTGIEGMGDLSEAFGPFAETFEELTGVELALYSLSNRTAAGTALQFDEVELVFAGPSEFVLFQQLADMDILFSIVRPHYGSSFVVRADSDIETLADLAGRRVALKDVGSTSGHIFPMMLMAEAGLDPETDAEIIMAGDARIQVLINGDVDAMGGGNKDWDAIRETGPRHRVSPAGPDRHAARRPGRDARQPAAGLPRCAARHAGRTLRRAVGKPDLDRAQRPTSSSNATPTCPSRADPAIYDVVRMAYEVAGIALDD